MLKTPNKVLLISPHTDDVEFGCGATISKLVQASVEIHSLVFSACEESVPDGYPSDILRSEVITAGENLGIKSSHISVHKFKVREFSYHRQEILDILISCRKSLEPDLVFVPATTDVHQDHQVVSQESIRAFRGRSMLGYELVWNGLTLNANYFVQIDEADISRKMAAINAYTSQSFRTYSDEETIRSLAVARGLQAGVRYAEAFEMIRWVE